MNFMGFFQNLGSSGGDLSNPDSIFEVICSDEGQAAFQCMLGFMKKCPEIMSAGNGTENPMAGLQNIPGFDIEMFMKEGGMAGVCAMLVGPCSKVKDCIFTPQAVKVKRETMASTSYYIMFHAESSQMCGEKKEQMTCMLEALDHCPDSVKSQVEAEFENALKISMPDAYGVVSFDDTKTFMQEECPKMPQGFAEDTCTKSILTSQNFTECNENVTAKYYKSRDCDVYELSKECIMDNLVPKCGEEKAMVFARNIHMIFPGIPDDCAGNISGGDVKQTSFGILLISTLIPLLYFF